ncbi:hypothetical protein BOQ04_10150 [Polynucleobacter sphagniphilus]|nr:hypothetical protein BOQ04_10150 [Polynucleobacter sphagniphilus]
MPATVLQAVSVINTDIAHTALITIRISTPIKSLHNLFYAKKKPTAFLQWVLIYNFFSKFITDLSQR